MSSTTADTIPAQHDSAVAILRDRESELDAEILTHQHKLDIAIQRREEILEAISRLSRKPRARKPRALTDVSAAPEPANDCPAAPSEPHRNRLGTGSEPVPAAASIFTLPARDAVAG